MTGRSEELRQIKPDAAHPKIENAGFEDVREETGRLQHWHYQRRLSVISDAAPEGSHYICFENDEPGRTAHILQGFAVDGAQIEALAVALRYRTTNVQAGRQPTERPAFVLHFYDAGRIPIGQAVLGPFDSDTAAWTTARDRLRIPSRAREAIVQVGLNGATGTLCVDDVQLTVHRR
jgi:protein-L-isoaspartate(D-aspartate) O-methyltransferase